MQREKQIGQKMEQFLKQYNEKYENLSHGETVLHILTKLRVVEIYIDWNFLNVKY